MSGYDRYAFKTDSIVILDSTTNKKKTLQPNQVALRSAIIPGWGQIINKQAIKVPVLYAGFAALGYFIYTNNKEYHKFKDAYHLRVINDPNHYDDYNILSPVRGPKYSDEGLLADREYYKRNRDLLIIISTAVYAANIVDAYVSAHLKDFDIGDNLSMSLMPVNLINIAGSYGVTTGFKLNLK